MNYYTKEAKIWKEVSREHKQWSESFFAYVRTQSRTKDKLVPLVDKHVELSLDDRNNANIMNNSFKTFSSVFTKENIESMTKPMQQFDERKGSKLLDN